METREYTTVDKSEWIDGPWKSEPDKMQWQDEATGLPCLIVRNRGGALCGYVGVPEGHPCFEVDYSDGTSLHTVDDDYNHIDVHGGLTFSDFCADTDDESRDVCHVPGPGEPDRVWWLGFNCAHCYDLSPKYASRDGVFAPHEEEVYRDIAYVKEHVRRLARQLAPSEPCNEGQTPSKGNG